MADEQIEIYRKKLDDLSRRVEEYKNAHGITSTEDSSGSLRDELREIKELLLKSAPKEESVLDKRFRRKKLHG